MPAPFKEKAQSNRSEAQEPADRPSYEEIALRAYYLYLGRGAVDGQDVADWVQAESELISEATPSARVAKA